MKTNLKQKTIVALAILMTACTLSFRAKVDTDVPQSPMKSTEYAADNTMALEKKKEAYYAINAPAETKKQKVSKPVEEINGKAVEQDDVTPDQNASGSEAVLMADSNTSSESELNDKTNTPLKDREVIKKNRWGVEPTFTKTFSMSRSGNLEVHTSGGSIEVVGGNGNEVQVQAFVKINGKLLSGNDSRLNEFNEGYELIIEKNGNTVTASAKRLGFTSIWKRTSVSFIVFAPRTITSALKTSGGSINISDLAGNQVLKTSGGSLSISRVVGNVSGNTSGGSINVSDQEGNMSLHTSGGSIKVHDAKGNVVGNTSGGSIYLNNIFGSAQVHTSGGGINIDGTAESVKASTSGGSIHANIEGLSQSLELSTSGGGIHASIPKGLGMNLDLKGNSVNVPLENFTGTAKKNYINGAMNGGGIPVVLRTSGGGVTVEFN